jgi:hypothetical protein
MYLAGIGGMASKQFFEVPRAVHGSCEATGHYAQCHTDA